MDVQKVVEKIASSQLVMRVARSEITHDVGFSSPVQRLIRSEPVQWLARHSEPIADIMLPRGRQHNIVIVAIEKKGVYHMLRRVDTDDFEAGKLDNVVGHVKKGESYRQAAYREISEETGLDVAALIREGGTLESFGQFHTLMYLRTSEGPKFSFLFGEMFVLHLNGEDSEKIRPNADEHKEVVRLSVREIMNKLGDVSTFDAFFFRKNREKLVGIAGET